MAEEVPASVTDELITKIWRHYLKDDELTISNCNISLVGEKGDNYSSIMCRAVCTVNTNAHEAQEKSLVIKTFPESDFIRKYVEESRSFEKEIKMLEEVLPAIEKILEKAGIHTRLGAEVYFSQSKPFFILAMEDLGKEQFAVANRFVGLCLEECLEVAKSLATFHAASIIYLQNASQETKDFMKCWIWGSERKDNNDIGIQATMKTIIDKVDSWSSEKWSDKLQKLLDGGYPDNFYKLVDSKDKKRPLVINHGDLWLNNIMFRHSSLESPQLRFVDLQLSWINSPIFDLIYFLFTSPRSYVRFQHMETFLKAYHEKFVEVCGILNAQLNYSYDDLKEDFKEHIIIGFAFFQFIYPILVAPRKDALKGDKQGEEAMKNNPIFDNEFFQHNFLSSLPFFEKYGVL